MTADVRDADLLPATVGGGERSALIAAGAAMIVALLLSMVLDPFLEDGLTSDPDDGSYERVPPWERTQFEWNTTEGHGFVQEEGPYGLLQGESEWNSTHVFVEYDLPLSEGGAAADPTDSPRISLAYWRPDVPPGVQVPVIAEFGPYFQEPSVQTPTIEVPGSWLGQMIVDQILPHGYAFAQVSVTGTGRSNHCMDLMGTAEQLGVDAAVTWLGTQAWSNGRVAMIGKSYDGSTPWQAAMFGNPHLSTIVPISGLIGVAELMWKNGSSEARAPIMHNGVYGSYGIDGDAEDLQNLCPDYLTGPATGGAAWAWGGEAAGSYWEERYFLDRVLGNYEGSVYLIQGMHDWNVDPHMAIPVINQLKDAGIDARGLFGQWDHDYPDRPDVMLDRAGPGRGIEAYPTMVRFDWMQDLLEWFDFYLRDVGTQPHLKVEIQSNHGEWRIEERYPPADMTTMRLELGSADLPRIDGGVSVNPDAGSGPVYETEPLEEKVWIAGLPRLHVAVTTLTNGGQLYALLEDCDDQGSCIHLGHAIMDLRYHAGGNEQSDGWLPGHLEEITAYMEFFGMDVSVDEGHTIRLTLRSTGEDYLPASSSSQTNIQEGTGSTLQLDLIDPSTRLFYDVPACEHAVCLAHEGNA